jgi:glycolate oxidase iron-sulfur subunit
MQTVGPDPALVDECVRCGFCLPTCPTYVLFGQEMDSPRGRIHLMKLGVEGEVLDAATVRHFDLCLGCMACVTACPSGVQYDRLIEATRAQVEHAHPRTWTDRLFRGAIFRLFPYPRRLRAVLPFLRLYQRLRVGAVARRTGAFARLPARLRAMESLLPPSVRPVAPIPARIAAAGARRATVGMLTGCVQRVFFGGVNAATARVLAAEGCAVFVPPGQGCCGALSMHAGREQEAQAFARGLIDTFAAGPEPLDAVVVNAAGCGSTMKEYGHLLAGDPAYADRAASFASKVKDATEFLAGLPTVATRHPVPARAAYHDACHLAHAQRIRAEPRAVLRSVPGLDVLEIREGEICCGSAGIYNLLEPGPAMELGARKAANVVATGADVLITANPGCAMQIAASMRTIGREPRVVHPMEVVDASIRGVSLPGATRGRRST